MATPAPTDPVETSQETVSTDHNTTRPNAKIRPLCRFYNTKKGCRAGDECRFRHEFELQQPEYDATQNQPGSTKTVNQSPNQSTQSAAVAQTSRVVQRPTPKALTDDPRKFQIGQVERRFKGDRSERDDATVLTFKMEPSDPDFPYEIEALECELKVPSSYPSSRPTLVVRNKDIPRGFQINIEKGFESLCADAPTLTLLGLMNRLDKQLETILSGRMADTVKIVAPKTQPKAKQSTSTTNGQTSQATLETAVTHTNHQLQEARSKRQSDLRQLEARFGKLQSFSKSSDGFTYTLPLDSSKRSTWPTELQQLSVARLTVPEMYPLKPVNLQLDSQSKAARNVEEAFKRRSADNATATITQLFNYLSLHVKEMAARALDAEQEQATGAKEPTEDQSHSIPPLAPTPSASSDNDRAHIKHIPRPPEWDTQQATDDSSDDFSDETSDSGEEPDDDDTQDPDAIASEEHSTSQAPAERGILLSFPHLELHGVELLELTSLHISVKCERCKEIKDVERLRSSPENSKMRDLSCRKCAAVLAVRFRADMIHANSVRAGYLDLEGCAVVDMLPSNFIPTCSECSTAYPAPGVVAVRGDTAMAICRECHKKMTLRIQEVKFLQTSAAAIRASQATGRKKAKENLGIVAGTELPRQGRCTHYRKSYRWFRFSCCSKVFACDRCHDEGSDHHNEHANRMICGFCSREQNYRPDDCGTCKAELTGKAGRGFWEGGKGTRDPGKMSRKDPRKYRNRNKTKPRGT